MRSILKSIFYLELHFLKSYRVRAVVRLLHSLVLLSLFYYIAQTVGIKAKFEYFNFVSLGIAYSILYQSFTNSSVSYLHDWRDKGVLELLFHSPHSRLKFFIASGFLGSMQSLLHATLIVLFSVYIFNLKIENMNGVYFLFSILVLIVICQSLSLISIASLLLWKKVNLIGLFSSLGVAILSGVYFPLYHLPVWLQNLAQVFPFRHGLILFRYSLGENTEAQNIFTSVLIFMGWAVALPFVAWLFYRRAESKLLSVGGIEHL